MSDQTSTTPGTPQGGGNRPRMSTGIKLVLMGVAGAALLYSCAPGIGSTIGGMPYFWFFGNPFYRGPTVAAPPSSNTTTTTPGTRTSPGTTTTTPQGTTTQGPSTRGGFGGTADSSSS